MKAPLTPRAFLRPCLGALVLFAACVLPARAFEGVTVERTEGWVEGDLQTYAKVAGLKPEMIADVSLNGDGLGVVIVTAEFPQEVNGFAAMGALHGFTQAVEKRGMKLGKARPFALGKYNGYELHGVGAKNAEGKSQHMTSLLLLSKRRLFNISFDSPSEIPLADARVKAYLTGLRLDESVHVPVAFEPLTPEQMGKRMLKYMAIGGGVVMVLLIGGVAAFLVWRRKRAANPPAPTPPPLPPQQA